LAADCHTGMRWTGAGEAVGCKEVHDALEVVWVVPCAVDEEDGGFWCGCHDGECVIRYCTMRYWLVGRYVREGFRNLQVH